MALIAHWPLDGRLDDISGNGYDLITDKPVVFEEFGPIGKSLKKTDGSRVYHENFPNIFSDEFTVSFYIKINNILTGSLIYPFGYGFRHGGKGIEDNGLAFGISTSTKYQDKLFIFCPMTNPVDYMNDIHIYLSDTTYTEYMNRWVNVTIRRKGSYLILKIEDDIIIERYDVVTDFLRNFRTFSLLTRDSVFNTNGHDYSLQNFRVYDEFIGDLEIRELNKLKLIDLDFINNDGPYENILSRVPDNTIINGYLTDAKFTHMNRVRCYTLTGSNMPTRTPYFFVNHSVGDKSISAGKSYVFSVKVTNAQNIKYFKIGLLQNEGLDGRIYQWSDRLFEPKKDERLIVKITTDANLASLRVRFDYEPADFDGTIIPFDSVLELEELSFHEGLEHIGYVNIDTEGLVTDTSDNANHFRIDKTTKITPYYKDKSWIMESNSRVYLDRYLELNDFTFQIRCMFKKNFISSETQAFSIYHPGRNSRLIIGTFENSSKLRIWIAAKSIATEYDVIDGIWYDMVVTRESGVINAWVNGTKIPSSISNDQPLYGKPSIGLSPDLSTNAQLYQNGQVHLSLLKVYAKCHSIDDLDVYFNYVNNNGSILIKDVNESSNNYTMTLNRDLCSIGVNYEEPYKNRIDKTFSYEVMDCVDIKNKKFDIYFNDTAPIIGNVIVLFPKTRTSTLFVHETEIPSTLSLSIKILNSGNYGTILEDSTLSQVNGPKLSYRNHDDTSIPSTYKKFYVWRLGEFYYSKNIFNLNETVTIKLVYSSSETNIFINNILEIELPFIFDNVCINTGNVHTSGTNTSELTMEVHDIKLLYDDTIGMFNLQEVCYG